MERREIISNFMKSICRREDVLGVIFYGSSCYKTDTLGSDVDLLFITDGDKNYKGTTYIDGVKIEYFEKNIYYLMEKIERLPFSFDRSFISIFKNGEILYSKNQVIEYLKEEILSRAKMFPTKDKRLGYESDYMEFYEQIPLFCIHDDTYSYLYYNLVESIRRRYHEEHGYSKLPSMKVYSLYQNPSYAEEFYCVRLPGQQFRESYLEMVTNLKDLDGIETFMNFLDYSAIEGKHMNKYYTKAELKYLSTIVSNMVDKTVCYLKMNHPAASSCYYVTLERIRKLYCHMNQIEDKISFDYEEYDMKFLELFHLCISHFHHGEYLEQLFCYVVESLQMDYKNYKILELS